MKTLLTADRLQTGIRKMAARIQAHYAGRSLTIVGVLIGSVILLADLIRLLDLPLRVELVQARSYRQQSTRPGKLEIHTETLSADLRGRNVLLVDDIFDTGRTLWQLVPQIRALDVAELRTAVLLRKQDRCEVPMQPDFVAFDIPNVFVVGYGLDYNDLYRNLPYVAKLDSEELGQGR